MAIRLAVLIILLGASAAGYAEVLIDLRGGTADLASDLRARLRLHSEPCDAPDWRVRRLFADAEQDFSPALRAFGFYTAVVGKHLEFGDDCWRAQFTVDAGERVRIRRRSVEVLGEADGDPRLQVLLQGLPLAEGEHLLHADYERIKGSLRQFAARYGYLDFRFLRQELRVYPGLSVADIHLAAESGPRYRFGEVSFGDQPLDGDFLDRLTGVRPGDMYDAADVTAMYRRLSDAGYFRRVEVRPQRDLAEDQRVPVEVQLETAARHAWRAGLGYATDSGPRASVDYENRYLNSRGHRFEAGLSVSPQLSGLAADYRIPGRDPHAERYDLGARMTHQDNSGVVSDLFALSAAQRVHRDGWTQRRFVELLHERSRIGSDATRQTLLMPGFGLERVETDDPLLTRRGYRIDLELRGAHQALLSDASFLRLRGGIRGIYRFGDAGRVLARLDAGSTLGASAEDLPASLRFFAGGDNSIRGYGYQSLGPVDAAGQVQGARHLLTGSVEYEHPIVGEAWWLAGFVDAGDAFDSDSPDWRFGYGAGLRWQSPVGRVRLDLAFPDDRSRDTWRVHFSLGADL